MSQRRGQMNDELGQVVVVFALLIPVLFAIGAIVLDVGNWYVHKRHLQTQVDAAALAGATRFTGCSTLFDPAAANLGIKGAALEYAGDDDRPPSSVDVSSTAPVRNRQVQEPGDVRIVLNSSAYWAAGDPTDGSTHDDTQDTDGDGSGDPCNERALDVKATDDEAPNIFGVSWGSLVPLHPSPKSHARVEILQVLEESGMLPFAVPEVDPAAVYAIFVNEENGAIVDWQQLCNLSTCTGAGTAPDSKFSYWTTSVGQTDVDIPAENTGVVLLISKNATSVSMPGSLPAAAPALANLCGSSPGLIRCHAGSSPTSGVNFIHGWSDAPGGYAVASGAGSPQVRDVSVFGCPDPSAPYFLSSADCTVGVTAKIDFGFSGDPTQNPPTGISAEAALYASTSCGGNSDPLTWSGTSGTESTWVGGAKTINAGSGRNPLSVGVRWRSGSGAGANKSKCFALVSVVYAADDASGPLEYVKITGADSAPYPPTIDPNSRNIGSNHNVVVTIGLNKPIQLTDPLAPPFLLRFASKSGSLNQALDCDAGIVFADEIADGCQTTYRLNYYDWDNDSTTPYTWQDINCDAYPNPSDLPPPTFVPPLGTNAPNCVAAKTGDVVAMRQGLYDRFQNPSCTPNNWPKNAADIPNFFLKYDFANDPRYVTLVITDFTAFTGSGAENVPVKYFAGFYATGWDRGPAGGGNQTGCPDNDPHPLGLSNLKDNGDVWGHFVNIVIPSANGEASDELCNFDAVGNCIAVLVE